MRLEARQRLIFGLSDLGVSLALGQALVGATFLALGRLEVSKSWYEVIGLTAAQLMALPFSILHGVWLSSIAAWTTFRHVRRPPVRAQELTLVAAVVMVLGFDALASDFPSGLPGLLAVAASQYVVTWGVTLGLRRLYLTRFDPARSMDRLCDSSRQVSD